MKKAFKRGQIFILNQVDSTNTYAAGLSVNTSEGSIVWALDQTKGRGQGENLWESEPGKNLTFSIILYPAFLSASNQFYISKIVSLAIFDLVSLYADNISIKWPNDIYTDDKKIAGILIENSIKADKIEKSVIGIGININQKNFLSAAQNPSSLSLITGKEYDLREILEILWEKIDFWYTILKEKKLFVIDSDYLKVLYRFNELSNFKGNGKCFKGRIINVNREGIIEISDEEKGLRRFLHKEVEYL
jgi:BirA family transcriptional regulator, biotin operon repressor / biotin---[acetyl-CoA-carboxylase] ligase